MNHLFCARNEFGRIYRILIECTIVVEKSDFHMCVHLFHSMKIPEYFGDEVVAERNAALSNNETKKQIARK